MRKVYYIYNPKTRTYDRIYPTMRQRVMSYLRRLFVGMGLGAGSFIVLLLIFGSPSEKDLRMENSRLQAQYHILSSRLDESLQVMKGLQQRDDNLYRVMMQADPVADALRTPSYNKTNRYEDLMELPSAKLVVNTTQKMDLLERQLYIQSKSFDEVLALCKKHDEMLECIPERPYYDEYGNDPCLDRISPNFIFQHFSIGFKLSVQFVIYVSSFAIRIFTMAHAARFFSYPEIQFLCLWRQICTISK